MAAGAEKMRTFGIEREGRRRGPWTEEEHADDQARFLGNDACAKGVGGVERGSREKKCVCSELTISGVIQFRYHFYMGFSIPFCFGLAVDRWIPETCFNGVAFGIRALFPRTTYALTALVRR